jgi:hypothetical protein
MASPMQMGTQLCGLNSSARELRNDFNQLYDQPDAPSVFILTFPAVLDHSLFINAVPQAGLVRSAARPDDRVKDGHKHSSIPHNT